MPISGSAPENGAAVRQAVAVFAPQTGPTGRTMARTIQYFSTSRVLEYLRQVSCEVDAAETKAFVPLPPTAAMSRQSTRRPGSRQRLRFWKTARGRNRPSDFGTSSILPSSGRNISAGPAGGPIHAHRPRPGRTITGHRLENYGGKSGCRPVGVSGVRCRGGPPVPLSAKTTARQSLGPKSEAGRMTPLGFRLAVMVPTAVIGTFALNAAGTNPTAAECDPAVRGRVRFG